VDPVRTKPVKVCPEGQELFGGVVEALDDEHLKPDIFREMLPQKRQAFQVFGKAQGGMGTVDTLEHCLGSGVKGRDDKIEHLDFLKEFPEAGKECPVGDEDQAFFWENPPCRFGDTAELVVECWFSPPSKGHAERGVPLKP
jgi:hypothetical protein